MLVKVRHCSGDWDGALGRASRLWFGLAWPGLACLESIIRLSSIHAINGTRRWRLGLNVAVAMAMAALCQCSSC